MLDQVYQDIKTNALEKWDYSSVYPVGFTGVEGPIVVDSQNWQLDTQLQALSNEGQFTRPYFSIELGAGKDEGTRTFGDLYGQNMANQVQGTTLRLGKRFPMPFLISVWVDQQLGGMPFARKLAGQVIGAMFYYRNRLTTIRHISMLFNKEYQIPAAQLWVVDLSYRGDVFTTIDV